MSRRRNVHLQFWLTAEESARLNEMARQWGYKTTEEFVRGGLGKQGQFTEDLHSVEKRQAATLTAMRTEIARLQRTEYVIFAMLENLAKTILTYMPMPAAENKSAAIALGKAAYERYLRAVGTSLNNGSKIALTSLAGLDG
ncbi:MAG TPA: hypothetical protein VH640_01700 [Bryobacteraceae bacterium]|jgi:hypothetical protein